jgi:hypothetical protein
VPAFKRVEFWTKLQCQGGTRFGVLYADRGDIIAASDIRAIDDQESLIVAFTRVDKSGATRGFLSSLAARSIVTVVWDDGSFDEWRVSLIDDSRGLNGPITVTANALLLDLAEGADSSTGKGLVSTTALCLRTFDFTATSITATQAWDTYVIPNCPSWVSRGTIDPTALIAQLTWSRLTPLALAQQIRDQLRKSNISCELRLRRNGTTDYKLDLVTQIGSTATVPLLLPRSNLQSLKRRIDASQQSTRLFVTGESDPSGSPGIPGRSRWVVTNVDGVNKKLTLADPSGGAGPIGMTDQWKLAYVLRVKTGRTFQIQAADATAQTVTLLDVSTFATNELIEFRLTEPGTNTRTITSPSPRFAISNVATNDLTLSGNPITVNGQLVDWYAKVWTLSSGGTVVGTPQRISITTAATDVIRVASGAGFNATMFVEFVQLDGAGEIPSYLDDATKVQAPPTGYGMKAGDLGVSLVVGVSQFVPNGWMRNWANPAAMPDGWSTLNSPTTFSQNTNPSFTRYGGNSLLMDYSSGTGSIFVVTPRFDLAHCAGNTRLSVRAQLWFTLFNASPTDFNFQMELFALDASGAITGAALGSDIIEPTNSAGGATKVATGAWVEMEIKGVDLGLDKAPYGLAVAFTTTSQPAAGRCTCYHDTVEVYGFVDNPTDIFEFGDAASLHQAGNRHLGTNAAPPIAYEVSIADLERQNPTDWARAALTLGGNVRVVDADLGVDASVRLLRLERDLLRPEQSTLGLSTLPVLLTQIL